MKFPDGQVSAVVLGIMQDAGLPHIGCRCAHCSRVYDGREAGAYAACLGLVDKRGEETAVWLFDATPDIKWQLNLLAGELGAHPTKPDRIRAPEGIFITHAHFGHIGGLPQLGPEAMAVAGLKVYASPQLCALLAGNPLWQPTVSRLTLKPLEPGQSIQLKPDLTLTAVPVPHRDEWATGTFGFYLRGPRRSLLYLPDIDNWDAWPQAEQWLAEVDLALVDACFFSAGELGSGPTICHPLVEDTVGRFSGLSCRMVLIHLNHTNPILDPQSCQRKWVLDAGVQIASLGQIFQL